MTGRELIEAICRNVQSFDAEIPIEILHRDSNMCVISRQRVKAAVLINGTLKLEGSSISNREP